MPAICLCKKNVNLLSNPTEMCAVCDFDFGADLELGVVQGQQKFGTYLFVCAAAIANETTRKKYADVVSSFASLGHIVFLFDYKWAKACNYCRSRQYL